MAVKIKVKPKTDPVEETFISKGRTPIDDTADVRDLLTALVGKGYTSLSDADSRADYQRLQALVGQDKAQKLATHAFIYNQNPANQRLPVEAKIKGFYDAPAGDPDVQSTLKKVGAFGYGVLPGFRESVNHTNQVLAGRIPATVAVTETPEQSKVKLRIANKL